jgi:hypothetical protein
MTLTKKTLFNLVVEPSKVHPNFEALRTLDACEPARRMLDEIYQDFEDHDGNFLEQFQTTGFDQRYFEIYLFAYFSRSGYSIKLGHPNPDFLVSRGGITVGVEATTVNPPTSGTLASLGRKVSELSPEELQDYIDNELAIRFGSPLFSKLQKKYWELEHCRDLPFVIAIEAFHDKESLVFTDDSLRKYVYGISQTASWNRSGTLGIEAAPVKDHKIGDKVITSNFFAKPDAEHISAVLFTNSGTQAKFARMGYQHGFGCDTIDMTRSGFCLNPDPDAMDPTFFSYNLDEPPFVESWGQGLVVLHNPTCLHPVPLDFFVNAIQHHIEDGVLKSEYSGWHPFGSKTFILYMGEAKKEVRTKIPRSSCVAVGAINKYQFHTRCGFRFPPENPFGEEQGWFSDETESFLGVIIQDKIDGDWGYIILARDENFEFRAIETNFNFSTRYKAVSSLQIRIVELLSIPKRIYSQGLKT